MPLAVRIQQDPVLFWDYFRPMFSYNVYYNSKINDLAKLYSVSTLYVKIIYKEKQYIPLSFNVLNQKNSNSYNPKSQQILTKLTI